MIKYELVCKKCNNLFDSWFAASKEYEKLKKLKHINCHFCGSLKVEKNLMSPHVVKYKKVLILNVFFSEKNNLLK